MSSISFASPTRAFCRIVVYGLFTLVCTPVQAVLVLLNAPMRKRFPQWYHKRCLRLLGMRTEVHGTPSRAHPTLYVVNHVSYLDITILGALLRASFVAKAEVAQWPVFGVLAKLQRTVFIARSAREAASQRDEMQQRLDAGDDLILFPEGTSGDGNRVLPFKSALFSVAQRHTSDGKPVTVQPVSLAYNKLDGLPMGRYLRPFFAWYGDMDLLPHIWEALALGTVTVEVTFHEPVTLDQVGSRKALSAHCQRSVAQGLSDSLSGHGHAPVERAEAA
jgi:1-acyl-sn-glycerol-3-phosphate acyltransferase